MLKLNKEQKDKINVLLNPDNYFGTYNKDLKRVLLFCLVACIPLILYSLLFINLIPLKYFLIAYVIYVIRVALIILGREKERLLDYVKRKNDIYSSSKQLIGIADIHEDGLVEYQNSDVIYIIECYGYSYLNDNAYSKDLEEFITRLTMKYVVDVYGQLVVDEDNIKLTNNLEKLRVYKDKDFLQERLDFYKYQDKYATDYSKLYRLCFVVHSSKNNWYKMKKELNDLINSDYTVCFDKIKICNKQEAIDIISRDICVYVDFGEMLRAKHSSNDYYGSKVLYFDDEIPENMKVKEVNFEDEGRRVIDDSEG